MARTFKQLFALVLCAAVMIAALPVASVHAQAQNDEECNAVCQAGRDVGEGILAIPELQEAEQAQKDTGVNAQKTFLGGTDSSYGFGPGVFLFAIQSALGKPGPDSTADAGTSKRQGGALQSMNKALAMLYSEPPATTERYIADVFNSAGITTPAYAQGLGFSALNPILETWKIFRNVAYLFFIVIFLAVGMMIMFRQRVGQTAVTAQQALPQIIIALLAVTFSYAIAGLLIDVMYLIMFLMVGLFGDGVVNVDVVNKSIFSIGADLIISGAGNGYDVVSNFAAAALSDLPDAVAGFLGFLGGLTFGAVVAVAILVGIFRLFFELLKTYVTIILSIALSPLILMMGAIPGRNAFFGWLKSLAGNLAAFPVVLMILILYKNLSSQIDAGQGGFMPPFLIGQGSGEAVTAMVGLGMLLIMSELVVQAKKALGGGGGIFDQFTQNISDSLKRGWNGAELVPGLGITNTANIPIFGSGKDFARKWATTAGAAAGGLGGAAAGAYAYQGLPDDGLSRSARLKQRAIFALSTGLSNIDVAGARSASALGEKQLYARTQKQLKAQDEKASKGH